MIEIWFLKQDFLRVGWSWVFSHKGALAGWFSLHSGISSEKFMVKDLDGIQPICHECLNIFLSQRWFCRMHVFSSSITSCTAVPTWVLLVHCRSLSRNCWPFLSKCSIGRLSCIAAGCTDDLQRRRFNIIDFSLDTMTTIHLPCISTGRSLRQKLGGNCFIPFIFKSYYIISLVPHPSIHPSIGHNGKANDHHHLCVRLLAYRSHLVCSISHLAEPLRGPGCWCGSHEAEWWTHCSRDQLFSCCFMSSEISWWFGICYQIRSI